MNLLIHLECHIAATASIAGHFFHDSWKRLEPLNHSSAEISISKLLNFAQVSPNFSPDQLPISSWIHQLWHREAVRDCLPPPTRSFLILLLFLCTPSDPTFIGQLQKLLECEGVNFRAKSWGNQLIDYDKLQISSFIGRQNGVSINVAYLRMTWPHSRVCFIFPILIDGNVFKVMVVPK